MILDSDRRDAIGLIKEAVASGAATYKACTELDITVRTYQRWTCDGKINCDGNPNAVHPEPKNKLSQKERQEILDIVNNEQYRSLPPSQIVPTLPDEGYYIASESSFYRVLHDNNQQHKRGRSQEALRKSATTHTEQDQTNCGAGILPGCQGQQKVCITTFT